MSRHGFDKRRRERQAQSMLQMIDAAREEGLHVAQVWRVPILKKRLTRPAGRSGGELDRRAQRHADGARAAERARLDARARTPEARGARSLATFLAGLGADAGMVLAAVDRVLARVKAGR